MKSVSRSLIRAVLAVALAFSSTAWAGKCCEETAEKVKKGEACAKCVEHECCKKAAEKVKEDGEAKECQHCAKKKEEPKG